jgi:hypothetical protein
LEVPALIALFTDTRRAVQKTGLAAPRDREIALSGQLTQSKPTQNEREARQRHAVSMIRAKEPSPAQVLARGSEPAAAI